MGTLSKGKEPNLLTLVVDGIDIKPYGQVVRGSLETGVVIKIHKYNLEDVLIQMLDDYGKDELIKRINSLD